MDSMESNILYDFETTLCNMGRNLTQEQIFMDLKANWENPTAFELLKVYGTQKKRLRVEQMVTEHISDPHQPCHDTSTAYTIIKQARSRLLDMKSKNIDVLSILSKTGEKTRSGHLTFEEKIDLGVALQASAELVAKKRFVSAKKLLSWCQHSASKKGIPLQRIVYYFSEALQQKMDQEWGFITPDQSEQKPLDVLQTLITLSPARMSCEQQFFTSVVCQYTCIQSILDNVVMEKRIHLIDLRIKNGSHWTFLIQALAVRYECPIELLKITAIGTSKELIEETGKWLTAFCTTMNVPFSYNIVLSELKEINEDMFEIEADEKLAIYSSLCLWTLLAWPYDLEKILSVFKGLNPCLMVTHEMDAPLNSSDFLERFNETLLHFCNLYEGMLVNFENHQFRKVTEEIHHRDRIRNTITCDGTERTYRHERSSFWRALFPRCGFFEAELSASALSQANLLLENSVNRNLKFLKTDGKCLTAGWDSIPLEFVSTWKLR